MLSGMDPTSKQGFQFIVIFHRTLVTRAQLNELFLPTRVLVFPSWITPKSTLRLLVSAAMYILSFG